MHHNTASGEDMTVHTNMIEGAWKHATMIEGAWKHATMIEGAWKHANMIEGVWKHAKDYFKCMNGNKMKNFESHIANIIMRNYNSRNNRCEAFIDLLEFVYHLQGPPAYTYRHLIHDTCSHVEGKDTISFRIDRWEIAADNVETIGQDATVWPVRLNHQLS